VSSARHRRRSLSERAVAAVAATGLSSAALVGLSAGPAAADVKRCVGAVDTPGAFACYTSPRFDQSGFQEWDIAEFPVVCYGLGCTGDMLWFYKPGTDVGGRFTSVSYLGHSYSVFRPDASQPYIVASDNQRLDPATVLQVLLVSMALDTTNGGA
jgi:hypothetical protein